MKYLITIYLLFFSTLVLAQEITDIQRIDDNSYTKTVVINKTFEELNIADAADDKAIVASQLDRAVHKSKIDEINSNIENIEARKARRQEERLMAQDADLAPITPSNEGVNW